ILQLSLSPIIAYDCAILSSINSIPHLNSEFYINDIKACDETLINHKMEFTIRTDNTIRVISTLVIENTLNESITYFIFPINYTITSVFVYDPIGSLTFSWEIFTESSALNITMRDPLLENQKYVVSISYEISGMIYSVNDYYNLEFIILHCMNTEHFQLIVYLPLNYGLIDEPSPRPYYPEPNKVYTRDNILVVEWEINDVDIGFEYFYTVRYIEIEPYDSTIVYIIPNIIYFYISLAFIGGILISTSIFFFIVRRKYQPVKQKLVSTLLSESEQAVIQAINDEGGIAIQRRICERTGYSKSKVSQILLKLEEKDILKRERWGRTNRVTITDDSFLNIELETIESQDEE
ncbi:MAG: winged helix DNA-binding protein, partial [Asgard group archaeon]|nr:winged helix DNA-binding protein [Asgard group archaeon]